MLKLEAVYDDLRGLAEASRRRTADRLRRRDEALRELDRQAADLDRLRRRADDARTSWLVAEPLESPLAIRPVAGEPAQTVVAVDGSQIYPDRHGPAACYLLNLGLVRLTYAPHPSASLDARPLLFTDEAELYPSEGGDTRAVTPDEVGCHRAVVELEALLELARSQSGTVVALSDGSLIPWPLARENDPWRQALLDRYLAALAGFEAAGVPVAGYISRSGAGDLVNLLRVGLCDQPQVNCDRCPHLRALVAAANGRGPTPEALRALPCGPPAGLTDGELLAPRLTDGARAALCGSRSKAFERGPAQRAAFFYLAAGDEVARVETPRWVAERPELLDRLHATVVDQIAKGRGYPVALQEAHEQAVVRGEDRLAFGHLLEKMLVEQGSVVRWSAKQRAKNRPGV